MQFIDLKKQYKILEQEIKSNINTVLEHGQFIMGPEVSKLERGLAEFTESKYCLSCSSGTDALLIALMAKGVGAGDYIITTPFTYIATAEVINLLGAKPVFVDIDSKTFNIDPIQIENTIADMHNKGLKAKGIIPVNLFGLPANYNEIYKIVSKHDMFVLEDAAQSFGAKYQSKVSGNLGDISATSFFPAKPLGCYGDGGAIFTNNKDDYDVMESIRIHGKGEDKYDCDRIGLNGRLDSMQAAILLPKLKIYNQEIQSRQEVANNYSQILSGYVQTPYIPEDYMSVWAQYSIVLDSSEKRKSIMNALKEEKIPSMIYYKIPLHLQRTFDMLGYNKGDFPVSETISNRIMSLPMHPYLEKNEIDKICKIILSQI